MTTTAVQMCAHLERAETRSYVQRGDYRVCLDCCHEIYRKTSDPRLYGIYCQKVHARG